MVDLLNDRVVVITGAASGIGRASAERFVLEGARVVIGDIADAEGQAAADKLGDAAIFVHTDVTNEKAIEGIIAAAVDTFGRLDVMFNNAGNQGDVSPLNDLNADGFDRTLALLTRSVALGHKYAAKQFAQQGGGGTIVSTSSTAGLQGAWAGAAYTAAKHAVVGLIRQSAAELAPLGVRSNAIAPGTIMTPIMARAFGVPLEDAPEFLDYLAQELGPKLPLGRVGRPDEIADVALFLASELSRYVTGIVVPIDGGASAITQGTFGVDVVKAAEEFGQGARAAV